MLSVEVKILDKPIVTMYATRIRPEDPAIGEMCYYKVKMEGSDLNTIISQPYDTKTGAQKLAIRLIETAIAWQNPWIM